MLGLGELPAELTSNRNISPGQFIPVVREVGTRDVELFKWGLVPSWAKDPAIGYKLINARSETIAEKPSFKKAFNAQRCLIPADGFYEWKVEGSRKNPYLFTMKSKNPFTFAGLWEYWHDAKGNEVYSCTIITTEPNVMMANYHDRMPVILGEEHRWKWLEKRPASELQEMLKPFPAEEMATPMRAEPSWLKR
jgi:putative SOS response-associated peptidase YedK